LCEPRYPSYREMLKAANKEIITWNGNDLGLERSEVAPFLRLGRVTEPRPRPKWIPIPDSELPAVERIRQLLSRDDAKKEGSLLEAGPEDLARSMIQFLKDEGLL
jgi:electron transfer flavoprotein alpha/beta subunit